jgi:hypothetical protein
MSNPAISEHAQRFKDRVEQVRRLRQERGQASPSPAKTAATPPATKSAN